MNKAALRQEIREKKRAMTESEIVSRSRRLAEMLIASPCYQVAKTLYGYLPYNQEVRTETILEHALREGKRVAVPKIYGDTMRFIYLDDLSQVATGYAGIGEPVSDEPVAEDPTALVLMPGVAFTEKGDRIGYGRGFYDRFLAQEQNHPTIALCYDFQILETLPTEEYDVPVDLVLWA